VLPGEVAFKLSDTHGFPLDLTEDLLKADRIEVDREGFEAAMAEQRTRARDAQKASGARSDRALELRSPRRLDSRFAGDFVHELESEVGAIFSAGREVEEIREGGEASVVVRETPFYAESGGQIGDRGTLGTERGDLFEVEDARKESLRGAEGDGDVVLHVGKLVRGTLRRGDRVRLAIDRERREAVRRNHSATHILHAVLRDLLGLQVRQAGSAVGPDRFRFDFTYQGPITPELLQRIEDDVNAHIRDNDEVRIEELAYAEAIRRGALAFFGDKYGERVRVLQMGDFSTELCGGTHVRRTGDIGFFKLRSEGGIAAGVRRVEALTAAGAIELVHRREQVLRQLGEILKGPEEAAIERLEKLIAQQKEYERRIAELQAKLAGGQSQDLLSQVRQVNGVKVLAARIEDADDKVLRELADRFRDRMGTGIVVLGVARDGKATLLAAVTKDIASRHPAGEIIKKIAPIIGGRGGGRPEMAQAGGPEADRLGEALAKVYEVVG
jgi:alanyl-tRNA synthetase